MKRRVLSWVLLIALLALTVGITAMGVLNGEILTAAFGDAEAAVKDTARWIYLAMAALIMVWVLLFVFYANVEKHAGLFGFGRTDALTGLGNRKQMRLSFNTVSGSYHRYTCLAYIAFDIRRIRERYGAEMGDTLQKGAADILSEACGDYDCAARVEDGVFALSLCCRDGLQAQQQVDELTDKLNRYQFGLLMEETAPFRAGLYLPERGKATFETALANAKIGYRYAADNRVNTFICTQDVLVQEASRDRLREKLSGAIDRKQFEMYLQFLYDVKQEKFVGAEVLSRWNSPEEGLLMPAYYINDMRRTGIIEKFDLYMLDKTCRLLEQWEGGEFGTLSLSCNITRITISAVDFMEEFRQIIKKYRFDHSRLMLEITEDALINNHTVAYRNITACKEQGFRIAIDDFGTGHSSFSDISDYPVDQIKVDRQIIVKSTDERGDALLHGIIHLAHSLGIETVCEGVETEEQRQIALKNECDFIQGYYYSYVFPVDEGKEKYRSSLAKSS